MGLATTPMTAAAVAELPAGAGGMGAAVVNAFRTVGLALGIALMGAVVGAGSGGGLAGGKLLFAAIGFVAAIPFLLRIHRRFASWKRRPSRSPSLRPCSRSPRL